MKLEITGRDGALTKYRGAGGAEFAEDMPQTGYLHRIDGADVVGSAAKKDIRTIQDWLDRANYVEQKQNAPEVDTTALRRIMIEVAKYRVGDSVNGYVISGLGQEFRPNIDQYSSNGIHPSVEYVQYAYRH